MLLSMLPGDIVIHERRVKKMSNYGKCGYCGTDILRRDDLRTDAKFCSKEHQSAYWTDQRRSKRDWSAALGVIERLVLVAKTDTKLGDWALGHLYGIAVAAQSAVEEVQSHNQAVQKQQVDGS